MDTLRTTKRGSSRRKGDEYQDLTALRIVLELYAASSDFKVFLEYEKVNAIDDIVVFTKAGARFVQAKYAVDPLAVYLPDDFTQPDSKTRTYFGNYATAWRNARAEHPGVELSIELVSNRGRDSTLEHIIGADGRFTQAFIEGRIRKGPRQFREKLAVACAFTGIDADGQFQSFVQSFHFSLGQRSLDELHDFIVGELLDHRLGISDRSVFHELKELIEKHAIESHEPIIPAMLDEIFLRAQRRFILPQVFPVEKERFVEVSAFHSTLFSALTAHSAGYIVITGLPGSGKSTSLSEFFETLEKDRGFAVCRYYCFVKPNDDAARRRVEAETLRVNLLSALHQQFPEELDRRYDYSEQRFTEVLAELGNSLSAQGRKLVILIDGLDHAERDPLVRESVLHALPTALPTGVLVVVGTQELKNWEPLALREGREQRHVPIELFTVAQTRLYLVEKQGLVLDNAWVERIHGKSHGLPLYLRYVAEWLREHNGDVATLDAMPPAGDGDIRNYYERLWSNFERDGMAQARHLCGVLAALRFPVHPEELGTFQDLIDPLDVQDALRAVAHLLRRYNGQVSIFHDSFRVFITNKLDEPTRRRIGRNIAEKLKTERGSPRWFAHVFHYAYEGEDDDYVLTEVDRRFIDFALQHCRPSEDIFDALDAAVKSAARRKDLIAFARLGALHYRTNERLEHQFDYAELAKVQLALGRVEEVVSFCCRPDEHRWLVNDAVAMDVMVWCAKTERRELGEQLFNVFRTTHAHAKFSGRHEIELLARVLGIYSKRPEQILRWLATMRFSPDTLERADLFAPGFAPHLAAFLEGYFLYRPVNGWHRLKGIKRLFPNHLVRHYILRLVARYRSESDLALELEDYLANTPHKENLEVAGLAVLAKLAIVRVTRLAGQVHIPSRFPDEIRTGSLEKVFDHFKWSALVLGYENDIAAIDRAVDQIGQSNTVYSGFLRFLLKAGLCLGQAAAGRSSFPYDDALRALRELARAGTEREPHEMDTLRACRPMLPEILFRLTTHIASKCAEHLDSWRDELLALRDKELWTSHWGLGESSVNYIFELRIWERLADVPGMSYRLLPILRDCADTYAKAEVLKAGQRCDHFLTLASIAARCNWRTDAEYWRNKGAACSLTYGYRKDVTLDYLNDVLELLSPHEPTQTLSRAAAILEMAQWMPAVSDNSGTKHFQQSVFRNVLNVNRRAGFALIRFFRDHAGRWKLLDCLEKFCTTLNEGDPEVVWALKDVFAPYFVEHGRNPKQVTRTTQHLRDLAIRLDPANATVWHERYITFIRTTLDPSWWPEDVWQYVETKEGRSPRHARMPHGTTMPPPADEFTLRGKPTSRLEIGHHLKESFDSYCTTVDQLRESTSYFYDRELVNPPLRLHIAQAKSLAEMQRLWEFARNAGDLVESESLQAIAHRLFEFHDSENGFRSLFLAYQRSNDYYPGSQPGHVYLVELCQRDRDRLVTFLTERCISGFERDYGGYDLPRMIARYYAACGDLESLEKVFEDYLSHCEELFASLPKHDTYGWLRTFSGDGLNDSDEIVHFLIDLLGESEIDQSERLTRALVDLAKVRGDLVCRIACRRMKTAEPFLRERLEVLLDALASVCPEPLAPYLETLSPLLLEHHFRLRATLVEIIHRVSTIVTLSPSLIKAADEAERPYTSVISYPSRRFLHLEPSIGFTEFIKKGALFDFKTQVESASELLSIPPSTILAYVEQRLRESGWSEIDEEVRLREDWDGNVWDSRVVWIVPRFHTLISEQLQKFLHEAMESGCYDKTVFEAIKNVVRGGDPDFIGRLPRTKPFDIPDVTPVDGQSWRNEIETPVGVVVETLRFNEWTTVDEERLISTTDGQSKKFASSVRIRSLIINSALTDRPDSWPAIKNWSDAIPNLHPGENLTLKSAQVRLRDAANAIADVSVGMIPLVSAHTNLQLFHGCVG